MAGISEIEVMISGGRDTDSLRNIAGEVLLQLSHMFRKEMQLPVVIDQWDYRRSSPAVVRRGEISELSLQQVEQANALVVTLAETVPSITGEEIERAVELISAGGEVEVFAFAPPSTAQPILDFIGELEDRLGLTVVFAPYENELDFQLKVTTTLVPFVLAQLDHAAATSRDA